MKEQTSSTYLRIQGFWDKQNNFSQGFSCMNQVSSVKNMYHTWLDNSNLTQSYAVWLRHTCESGILNIDGTYFVYTQYDNSLFDCAGS